MGGRTHFVGLTGSEWNSVLGYLYGAAECGAGPELESIIAKVELHLPHRRRSNRRYDDRYVSVEGLAPGYRIDRETGDQVYSSCFL